MKRPRGIFPSLPGGMDLVIKAYFDKYRIKGDLPPEIVGKVKGKLFPDIKILEKWRSWKNTSLIYKDNSLNAILSGALDDCIIDNNLYSPLDYKTRGMAIKEDSSKYYQVQLDCYCLMLESTGYKTKNMAYLVYYWPKEVQEDGAIRFSVETIPVKTNIQSAKKIFRNAIIALSKEIPKESPNCEYCKLVADRKNEL